MRKKQKYILTQDEWKLIIHALNDLRNQKELSEGKVH